MNRQNKIECTLSDCKRSTYNPQLTNPDPRKRWIVGLKLLDTEGCLACEEGINSQLTHTCVTRTFNFCPDCARKQLNLTEIDYQRMEKGEAISQGKLPQTELIQ